MFRILPFILLACGFAFGQGVAKPDLGRMLDGYKNDPLLAETIAVFSLPPERAAERNETLTRLCEEGHFPRWADMVANQLASDGNEEAILAYQESVVLWLEQSDPQDLHGMNLSWVACGALRFFDGTSNRRFPSLLKGDWRKVAAEWCVRDKGCLELAERRYRIARRLATAFVRIHSTAEEGFRLVSAAGGMEFPKEEMDAMARAALAATGDSPPDDHSGDQFFHLRSANGGSGADNTNRHSSVRWLSKRLDEAPADEVIPPSWLAGLKETDPGRAELVAALRVRCSAADLERLWTPERVHTRNFGSVSAMLFRQIFARATATPGCVGFFEKALRGTDAGKHETLSTDNSPLNVLCQGALMAAATSDEPGRESLCRLVADFMYGGAGVGDELYSPKNMRSHEFTMQAIFRDWPFDDKAVSLRLLATLHRLRIPVGASEHAVHPMFYGKPPLSFEAAEQLLVSSGWLGDARGWEPPRVHYRTFRLDSRKRKGLWLKEALIGRELVDHPEFHNQQFVDWLKERGHPRFGVLLFASRLTYQEAADELILAAFSDMGGEWPFRTNTLPPQIELIIGTMQPEAAAKLPANLRPRR